MSKKSRLTSILFLIEENSMQTTQMHLSQKQKQKISLVFYAFFKSTLHFEHFQRKMTLIAYVIPKLRTR